jgi:LEA14-like dessication related protein
MKRRVISGAIIVFILSAALLCSCSVLNNLMGEVKIRNPEVDFAGAKLTGLSFDAADLLFDLRIRNPNPVGVKMAGFDYDFLINGNSFLKGEQRETLRIQAEGESTVQLPLSLNYEDLYQTFQGLRNQDASTYQIRFGLSFELPVLGVVDVPLSKTGEFPMLKLPKVKLAALKLESLTLAGADLLLRVQLDNPNAFSMLLEKLQYQFEVNGRNWVSASAEKTTQVAEKGQGFIEIPISLNLLEMGTSVYKLLTGDKELSYQFGGKLDFATSLPIMGKVSLPFERSGSVNLTR